MISPFDRAHIGEIIAGDGSWFTADLLRLCAHADRENLAKLRLAFPGGLCGKELGEAGSPGVMGSYHVNFTPVAGSRGTALGFLCPTCAEAEADRVGADRYGKWTS